ncbi:MAG: ABC transporter substrate-binding protein [Chitinophagales bacterium]
MKTIYSITVIIAVVTMNFTSGCKSKHAENNKVNYKEVSDSLKFVHVPDADSILPEWSKENVVINIWPGDPDNLHPTNGGTAPRSWVLQYLGNYILRSDIINLGVSPDLAESMPEESEDHLRYTYHLRKDARWDDGSAITAEDAVFMLKANKCPLTNNPSNKPYFENIKDVEIYADDPYKFTIIMKKPYIQNLTFLGDYVVMQRKYHDPKNILAKYTFAQFNELTFDAEAATELNEWANEFNDPKYGNDPAFLNLSGPYKVAEWTRGQSLILERKKDHWTQKLTSPTAYETAFPEKIIFKINTDPTAQKLEFRSQAVDASVWIPTPVALELMKEEDFNKNYNLEFTNSYNYNYISMNMQPDGTVHKKIFTDVKVRRAMAYLIPMDEIISVLVFGQAKRQATPVSPLKPEYNSDLPLIPFDVEAAKKLLDEAGWIDTDGDNVRDKIIDGEKVQFKVELKYQGGQKFIVDVVNMIKEAAYRGGVEFELVGLDPNTLKEQQAKHDFDMYISAWSGGSIPEDYTQIWHTSSYANGGSNYCGFGNAASDALIDSIKYTLDDNLRIPMVKRLQKMIYDEQPYIFLYSVYRKNIIHKRFGNQFMTFDRPGVVLNNLRLLSLYGADIGSAPKATTVE